MAGETLSTRLYKTLRISMHDRLPAVWPAQFDALYSSTDPAEWKTSQGRPVHYFLTESPSQLVAGVRTADDYGLRELIDAAKESLCLEVMDYAPVTLYAAEPFYWGYLDDAFRSAAQRGE